jgi:hypothetical protein
MEKELVHPYTMMATFGGLSFNEIALPWNI